jgi:hypothetical protein
MIGAMKKLDIANLKLLIVMITISVHLIIVLLVNAIMIKSVVMTMMHVP